MDSGPGSENTPPDNTSNVDAIGPLLTLALGASEEVNTSDKNNPDKNSYALRSKEPSDQSPTDSAQSISCHNTPLNSPIVNRTDSDADDVHVRVIPSSEVDLNPVFSAEHLNLVQIHAESECGEDSTGSGEEENDVSSLPAGLVMIEQSVLEQISGFLKNAGAITSGNIHKIMSNAVTSSANITTLSCLQDQENVVSNSATNGNSLTDQEEPPSIAHQQLLNDDDDDGGWIDTKATATQLTDELRRYHIPQAVFAKKVLNRSQGTLSDILRKPKPWNEMRLGKEIFRKMKEWLSLPEVKRIPQLRTEAARELDSRAKRQNSESIDDSEDSHLTPKKIRRQFTESQKRALFAIFKETKKPTKEMQLALAEELGLDLTTVSNFFMNARRRHVNE